jgi:hypothetical protein
MKKLTSINKWLIILAAVASLGFSSCKKGWWGYDEGGNGGGGNGGGGNGNEFVQGTVINFNCGKTIYGYWIKLDNGLLLQPCDQSFNTFCGIILNEGDRVEIKYSPYKGSTKDFQLTCKALFSFERVTIDYINIIGFASGCKPITFPDNYDDLKEAGVSITSSKINNTSLVLNIGFGGCGDNTERFGIIAKLLPSTGAIPAYEVKIVDKKEEMCMAYFTKDVCIDISSLKNPLSSSSVKIKLVGYDKEIIF